MAGQQFYLDEIQEQRIDPDSDTDTDPDTNTESRVNRDRYRKDSKDKVSRREK